MVDKCNRSTTRLAFKIRLKQLHSTQSDVITGTQLWRIKKISFCTYYCWLILYSDLFFSKLCIHLCILCVDETPTLSRLVVGFA